MSFSTPTTVPSGMSVPVLAVDGRIPESLADFVGDTSFLVDLDPPHLVQGAGSLQGDVVSFHEKDMGNSGKDVRVWEIRIEGSRFTAQHAARF